MSGSAPYSQQQLHRGDVARVGRAPERRRAALVDAQQIEVVLREPDLARAGARSDRRPCRAAPSSDRDTTSAAAAARAAADRTTSRRPLDVEHREERRHAARRWPAFGSAPCVEQVLGDVELTVDRRRSAAGSSRSPALSALTLAPPLDAAPPPTARCPARAAKCSAVRPPCVPTSSLNVYAARDAGDAAVGCAPAPAAAARRRAPADAGALRPPSARRGSCSAAPLRARSRR